MQSKQLWLTTLPLEINAHYRAWLQKKRLSKAMSFSHTVYLHVVAMEWSSPASHEKTYFSSDDKVFIRRIQLCHQGSVISTGRLCIDKQSWQYLAPHITNLGNQPIGETWLHDSKHNRSNFLFRPMPKTQQQALDYPNTDLAWERYSTFIFSKQQRMILTESLSPALIQWPLP